MVHAPLFCAGPAGAGFASLHFIFNAVQMRCAHKNFYLQSIISCRGSRFLASLCTGGSASEGG